MHGRSISSILDIYIYIYIWIRWYISQVMNKPVNELVHLWTRYQIYYIINKCMDSSINRCWLILNLAIIQVLINPAWSSRAYYLIDSWLQTNQFDGGTHVITKHKFGSQIGCLEVLGVMLASPEHLWCAIDWEMRPQTWDMIWMFY